MESFLYFPTATDLNKGLQLETVLFNGWYHVCLDVFTICFTKL